jgi:sortase B
MSGGRLEIKMNKTVKTLLIILCVVCVGVFCYSGYKLFYTLNQYKVAQRSYNEMSEQYVTTESPAATEAPVEENDTSDETKEVSPIKVDFDQLLSQNEDVCGWLYSKDTVINYPVAQGDDNNEYLHHLLDGSYNSSGTLFVDCECGPEFSGTNTIVYGHNMKDGSMFNSLTSYKDQTYYDEHPVMYLNTPKQNYKIEIFTAYICNYDSDTYTHDFYSADEYASWLTKMKSQSSITCDVDVDPANDRVITLSTCTYEYDNARFVVQGKLVALDG